MTMQLLSQLSFSERYDEIHLVVQRTLRKYFFRFCASDAYEDLVQESMTAVFEAVAEGRLRDPQSLLNFTASVAFYTGCKVVPKARRLPEQLDEVTSIFPDRSKSPEEALLAKERDEQLDRAIASLKSALDRELLRRYFRGEQVIGTRAGMQLTPGQFRNRKSRALKNLSVILQKQHTPSALKARTGPSRPSPRQEERNGFQGSMSEMWQTASSSNEAVPSF